MPTQLVAGDVMPAVFGKDAEANLVDMTASVAGNWALIQFYRGDW